MRGAGFELIIVRTVHHQKQIEAVEILVHHLARRLVRNVDAARARDLLRAMVRRLADMPIAKPSRVDHEAVGESLLSDHAAEHALGHWRTADIAEADE